MGRRIIFGLVLLLSLPFCRKEESQDKEIMGLLIANLLYTPYEKITPEAGTITIPGVASANGYDNRTYTPSCSGLNGDKTFSFFRKKRMAANKKLLINFMGGGACWSGYNCFGDETTTHFSLFGAPDFVLKFVFQGITNENNPSNPFKDYDVIFIPYCTADLHFGTMSGNNVYTNLKTGLDQEVNHRGHENLLSVMKYIQSEYTGVEQVFVAGQSAGGYGALLNYPVIRETFTQINATIQMGLLVDAANGVVPVGFLATVNNVWGMNPPTWVGTIAANYFTIGSIEDYFTQVANQYPTDQMGQYTALFDGAQRFFYHTMIVIAGNPPYTDAAVGDPFDAGKTYSALFGDMDGSTVPDGMLGANDGSTCDWSGKAVNSMKAVITAGVANYSYYIGPGDVHTITSSDKMYFLNSTGINFVNWMTQLANGNNGGQVRCLSGGFLNCGNSNLNSNSINSNLGTATSDESFPLGRNLLTKCNPASYL
ncbi:pectin acetylesterase-family hydrolase [Leptospira sp. WS92.C1]